MPKNKQAPNYVQYKLQMQYSPPCSSKLAREEGYLYLFGPQFVCLQPSNIVRASWNGDGRSLRTNLSRGDVALVDADVARVLIRNGDLTPVLAELKVTWEETARGSELNPVELTTRARLESGDGVGVDLGAVAWVNVGDLLQGDIAVGGDEKIVVGRNDDLSGSTILGDSWVGGGTVGGLLVNLLESKATRTNVGHFVGDDLGDELVDDEEEGLGAGLPENGVAGAVPGRSLELGLLNKLAGRWVYGKDVGDVETEIREDDKLSGGVEDGVVDVRAIGLLRLGPNWTAFIADVLEQLESTVVDVEGGETVATVMGDGQVLVVVV